MSKKDLKKVEKETDVPHSVNDNDGEEPQTPVREVTDSDDFAGATAAEPEAPAVAEEADADADADVDADAPAKKAGRKSPIQIYREETAKTQAVKEQLEPVYEQAHETVEQKKQVLPETLGELKTKLDEEAAAKLKVSQENVDRLTNAVDNRYKQVHSLEAQLRQALENLQEEKKELSGAESVLRSEAAEVTKENNNTYSTHEKELKANLKAAQAEEKAAKKALKSGVRQERMATLKNTVKGTLSYAFGLVAAVPDVVVRAARSVYGAAAETLQTFNRVAKRTVKEYKKPTWFTKLRN